MPQLFYLRKGLRTPLHPNRKRLWMEYPAQRKMKKPVASLTVWMATLVVTLCVNGQAQEAEK
jgi:hypothetical protein